VPQQATFDYDMSQFGSEQIDVTAQWDEAGFAFSVPEPSTFAIVSVGLAAMMLCPWPGQAAEWPPRIYNQKRLVSATTVAESIGANGRGSSILR
jgi:hypothetical protein